MAIKVQQVFISYSHEDLDFVNQLAALLISCDLNVWKDTKDISIGGNIPKTIYEGIKSASHFCCVISKSSVQSAWVEEELSYAKVRQLGDQSLQIVPILIDVVEIPDYLKAYRCAHLQNRDLSLNNLELIMVLRAFGVNLRARITHILTGTPREEMLSCCKTLSHEIYKLRDRMEVYDKIREEYRRPAPFYPANYGDQAFYDKLRESKLKELQRGEQQTWDKLREIAPGVSNSIAAARSVGTAAGLKIFLLTDRSHIYSIEEFYLWKDLVLILTEVDNMCEILISNETMGFNSDWKDSEYKVYTWTRELVKAEAALEGIIGILRSWSSFDKDIT